MTEEEKLSLIVIHAVKAAQAPLLTEIGYLKAAVTELQARIAVPKDAGTWRAGVAYTEGDLTTFKNQGWVCRIGHTAGAAFSPSFWRLFDRGARG